MTDKIPEHELISATMQVALAAAAKVLAQQFFFNDIQVGMFELMVQREIAEYVGTDELQEDIANQIAEFSGQ